MNYYGASAAEATATIEAQVQASVEKAHKAYAYREEIDGLRGRGRQGSASVTVDPTGLLLALTLDDSVTGLTPREIEADVMAAVQAAQREVAEAVNARTREVWGNNDPVTRQMEKELEKRFEAKDPDADISDGRGDR